MHQLTLTPIDNASAKDTPVAKMWMTTIFKENILRHLT